MAIQASIGSIPYNFFLARSNNMDWPQTVVETISHPGTDYDIFRLHALGTREWTLETRADYATQAACVAAFDDYSGLAAQGVQDFAMDGINYSTAPYNIGVKVIRVDKRHSTQPHITRQKIVNAINGNSGFFWVVSATWSLRWMQKP